MRAARNHRRDRSEVAVVDMIDREVQELCQRWPALREEHSVVRRSHGRYRINGRDVQVQVVTAEGDREDDEEEEDGAASGAARGHAGGGGGAATWPPSPSMRVASPQRPRAPPYLAPASLQRPRAARGPGDVLVDSEDLVVRDGPLSQPFLDYVFDTGANERYAEPRSEETFRGWPLQRVAERLELEYRNGLPYHPSDRLSAMRLASYEAHVRDMDARRRLHGDDTVVGEPFAVPVTGLLPTDAGEPAEGEAVAAARAEEPVDLVKLAGALAPRTAVVGWPVEPRGEPKAATTTGPKPWPGRLEQPTCSIRPGSPRAAGGAKRRHLYGEVIVPGALAVALAGKFAPDEPVDLPDEDKAPM